MFSRLDSYFTATIRHAESADTRLGIHRDEQREEGRQKKEKGDKDDESAGEDSIVVSVFALLAFLESLTAGQSPAAATATPSAAPPPPSRQANAARAYQATARSSAPPVAAPQIPAGDRPVLTSAEVDTVHKLIADLKVLAGHQVEQLSILRSESFLQGLVDAAARARSVL